MDEKLFWKNKQFLVYETINAGKIKENSKIVAKEI